MGSEVIMHDTPRFRVRALGAFEQIPGCPDYAVAALGKQRPTLYYARVIQQAQNLINGDPFGCEYDEDGVCIKRNYCIGKNAARDNNCAAPAEPRAWTSPIFLEYPGTDRDIDHF